MPRLRTLSVIIPCFNEEKTVAGVIERLRGVRVDDVGIQVIVTDDGSTDATPRILERYRGTDGVTLFRSESNRGKGNAVAAALPLVLGEAVLIQDADAEYDPSDIAALVAEFRARDGTSAVYGSRNLRKNRFSSRLFHLGGRLVTSAANLLYGLRLTDMPTGYKLIATDDLRRMNLRSRRFEFCAEVTAKLARLGTPIVEVPIRYEPRSFAEGKKIRASDGAWALVTLARWRAWRPKGRWTAADRLLRRLRADKALARIRDGERVMDVGCGTDRYLWNRLRSRGISYVGVDARIGVPERDGAAEFLPSAEGSLPFLGERRFTKIVGLAVLEHMDDPAAFLAAARALLDEGGELILTTPTPAARPVLETLALFGIIDREEIEEHKRYFAKGELLALVRAAGFPEATCRTFECGFNHLTIAR